MEGERKAGGLVQSSAALAKEDGGRAFGLGSKKARTCWAGSDSATHLRLAHNDAKLVAGGLVVTRLSPQRDDYTAPLVIAPHGGDVVLVGGGG